MKSRVLALVLAITLGLQSVMPVWAEGINVPVETDKTSSEITEKIKNETELFDSGLEYSSDVYDEPEVNNDLVLDESNSTFIVGTPTIEYVDNKLKDEESSDNSLYFAEDDFIVDSEVISNSETVQNQNITDQSAWPGDRQIEEEYDTSVQKEINKAQQIGLLLSVSDAWVLDCSEEKNIIPVKDNHVDFTDISAVQTERIGYSLNFTYRKDENTYINADDEFVMELPARYLEYEDIAKTPFLMHESKNGSDNEYELPIQVGTYEVTNGQLKIVFDNTLAVSAISECLGQVELCAFLKYDALYTNMLTKETAVVPEYAGGCRVWTDPEIALTFPLMDAVNGLEQSCEFDEKSGTYVWSVTVGSLTPGLTLADYGLEDTVDTGKMQIVSAEAENESLAYTETEDGIRFLLPADALTPYTVRIGIKPLPQMESTEAHEEAYTNTVCLSHTWLPGNDKLQWKSVEMCELQPEAPSMSKESSMPEAVPTEVAEEADGETMIAYGAETAEGAVVPPLTDWEYDLVADDRLEEEERPYLLLLRYIGTDEVISIPSSYSLDGTEYELFINSFRRRNIKKVIFPKTSVKGVDPAYLFEDCKSLEEVVNFDKQNMSRTSLHETFKNCESLKIAPEIPSTITEMYWTFAGCKSLEKAPDIPPSVLSMDSTFANCVSLQTAPDIPSSVTDLHTTFSHCISLEEPPYIPPSAKIESLTYTFSNCRALKSAPNIPDSVVDMRGTFSDCWALEEAPEIPYGVRYMYETFWRCSSLEEMPEIPDSVKSMPFAFENCTSLTEVSEIPASVTDMGYTFAACTALETAPVLPNSVTCMNSTFWKCTSLRSAPIIPGTVTDMNGTFMECTALRSAPIIPDTVTDMNGTFMDCAALEDAPDIPPHVENMKWTFENCLSLKGKMNVYNRPENGCYEGFFLGAAQNASGLVVNYCDENADLIDSIIETKLYAACNITKGDQVEIPFETSATLKKKSDYLLCVTDTQGKPIEGVEVVYGSLSLRTTNKKGEVRFQLTEEMLGSAEKTEDTVWEDAGEHTLKLSKEGYVPQEKENFWFYEDAVSPHIRMVKVGEEALSSALLIYDGTEYDILEHDATLDTKSILFGSSKDFSLQFKTTLKNTEEYSFEITQKGKTIAENDVPGVFYLNCADFQADEDAYLIFLDKTTKSVVKLEKLRISFIDSEALPDEIELGSSYKIKIGDNIPLLGGQEISLSSLNLPIEFSLDEEGKFKIGLNVEMDKSKCGIINQGSKNLETERSFKKKKEKTDRFFNIDTEDLRKRLKDKDKITSAGSISFSWNVGGYLEGSLADLSESLKEKNSDFLKKMKGSVFVEIKMTVSTETGYSIAFIPCVFAIDGKGGVQALAEWDKGLSVHLCPEVGLTVFSGPGFPRSISAGVYGEAKTDLDYLLETLKNENCGIKEWKISGNVGLMARIGGKEFGRISIMGGTYYIINGEGAAVASSDENLISVWSSFLSDMSGEEITEELNRDYLSERSAWQSTVTDEVNKPQILQSNTYMDIQPTLLSAAGREVMVWADDFGDSRDSANRTAVVYSVFDEAASAWSEPTPLEDDGTADFSPAMYSDGTDVYVIWQDAKEPLKSEMTLSEQSALLELNTAKLDLSGRSCELLGTITDNSEFELSPRLSVVNGQLTAGWYTNSEGNPLGAVGRNTFYSAAYHDGLWSQPQSLVESGIVMSEVAEVLNGTAYTAIVEDTDMDLTTMDDRCLYLLEETTKEKIEISSDITGKVCSTLIGGKRALCWAEGSTMRYLASLEEGVQTLLENSIASGCDYQVFGDENGNITILYFVLQDSQTKLMAQSYDPADMVWGEPAVLVSNGKYVERASGYYENGRLVLAYTQTEVTDMQKLDTICDFCYMVLEGKPNVVIEDIRYDEYGAEPGGDLNLTICVRNTGSEIARNVSAEILDEDGTIAGTTAAGQDIVGGDSAELKYVLKLPEDGRAHRYSSRVGASTFDFTVGQGRLVVIAEKEEYSTAGMLAVHVRNVGLSPTGGTLEIYDSDKQDTVYLTEEIPELAAGDTYLYRCLDSSLYPVDDKSHTLGVRVTYETGTDTDLLVLDPGIYTIIFDQGKYGNDEKTEVKVKRGRLVTEPNIDEDIMGWYLDQELTTEWNFNVAATDDMVLYAKWDRCEVHQFNTEVCAPTCTEQGYTLYSCVNCPYTYQSDFVEAVGHDWEEYFKAATCIQDGEEGEICKTCQEKDIRKIIPKLGHKWEDGKIKQDATVFHAAVRTRICSVCKTQSETLEGSPLKATMILTADSLPMRVKQKTTVLKVTGMAKGDYLKSVVSDKTALVKVSNVSSSGTFKLTAKNKTGTARITIKLASGLTKTVKIKVQKKIVQTKKILGLEKKLTIKKGQKVKLRPVLKPLTSQQKVKFKSANKKVVSVSSKGIIKGIKPGKAKITVISGSKKFVCTVTVVKN